MTREKSRCPDRPMTIVLGVPRSGTTMIAVELERWFDLAIPFETHFGPLFARWQWIYGDLSSSAARKRLLNGIYAFTRLWLRVSVSHDTKTIEVVSVLLTRADADRIIEMSHDYQSLIRAVFRAYAERRYKSGYAEKSAYRGVMHYKRLESVFGRSNVIDVVRDGRDQFLSWSRTWFGSGNIVLAARSWCRSVDQAIRPARVQDDASGIAHLIVRYEDYVRDPTRELDRIADFLEIEKSMTAKSTDLGKAVSKAPEHQLLSDRVNARRVAVYKTEMPTWQLWLYHRIAGRTLRAAGYQVDDVVLSWTDYIFILRAYAFMPFAWLVSKSIDLAKVTIPAILFLIARFKTDT